MLRGNDLEMEFDNAQSRGIFWKQVLSNESFIKKGVCVCSPSLKDVLEAVFEYFRKNTGSEEKVEVSVNGECHSFNGYSYKIFIDSVSNERSGYIDKNFDNYINNKSHIRNIRTDAASKYCRFIDHIFINDTSGKINKHIKKKFNDAYASVLKEMRFFLEERINNDRYKAFFDGIAKVAPSAKGNTATVRRWLLGNSLEWPVCYHTLRQSEQERMFVYSITKIFDDNDANCFRFSNSMTTSDDGGIPINVDGKNTEGISFVVGGNNLYFIGSTSYKYGALKIMTFSISDEEVNGDAGLEILRGHIVTHSPKAMLASRLLMFRCVGDEQLRVAEKFAGSNPYRFFDVNDNFLNIEDDHSINKFLYSEFSNLNCCLGKDGNDKKSIFHSYMVGLANTRLDGLGSSPKDLQQYPAMLI